MAESADPQLPLRNFRQTREFFIGIDSDGCAFDSMEVKHKECFIPEFVNLDCERHFPTWNAPANGRASGKITRVNNGTHPSTEGYNQMGDSIYCWLKAVTPVESK